MSEKVKIQAPWITFYNEIEALFGEDPAIKIQYDDDTKVITLRVEGEEKADALTKLLPPQRVFGNITVNVRVVPANNLGDSRIELFQKAFEGNPAFSRIERITGTYTFSADYVVFKKKVVQFFDDDLSALGGVKSTLYQDIAKDLFEGTAGIYFCTEIDAE